MSKSIVDRILEECNARKSSREAILGRGSEPDPEAADQGESEALLGRFEKKLAPVIGRAVSSELREALEKASRDILDSLERELPRMATSLAARSPREGESRDASGSSESSESYGSSESSELYDSSGSYDSHEPSDSPGSDSFGSESSESESLQLLESSESDSSRPTESFPSSEFSRFLEEQQLDTLDTDLDLPADEVERQLDQVFGFSKPLEFPSPANSQDSQMTELAEPPPEELPESVLDDLAPLEEPGVDPDSIQEEDSLEGNQADHRPAIPEFEAPEVPGETSAEPEDQKMTEEVFDVSEPEIATKAVSLPEAPDTFEAAPPRPTAGPSTPGGREAVDSIIPRVTEEVTRIVEEIEKGQMRLFEEMGNLVHRVAHLETVVSKQDVEEEPEPVQEESEAAKKLAEARERALGLKRKSPAQVVLLEYLETIVLSIQELEKRILYGQEAIQASIVERSPLQEPHPFR